MKKYQLDANISSLEMRLQKWAQFKKRRRRAYIAAGIAIALIVVATAMFRYPPGIFLIVGILTFLGIHALTTGGGVQERRILGGWTETDIEEKLIKAKAVQYQANLRAIDNFNN